MTTTKKKYDPYLMESFYKAALALVSHRDIRDRLLGATRIFAIDASEFMDDEMARDFEKIKKALTRNVTYAASIAAMSDIEAGEISKDIFRLFCDLQRVDVRQKLQR